MGAPEGRGVLGALVGAPDGLLDTQPPHVAWQRSTTLSYRHHPRVNAAMHASRLSVSRKVGSVSYRNRHGVGGVVGNIVGDAVGPEVVGA